MPKTTNRATAPKSSTKRRVKVVLPTEDERPSDAESDYEEADGNALMDLMNIVKKAQQNKVKKATTNTSTFAQKQASLFKDGKEVGDQIVKEGNKYFEQARLSVSDWRSREEPYDKNVKDLVPFWVANEKSMEELSATYSSLVNELPSRRAEEINSGSHMVEHLPSERAKSRRRLMKNFEARVAQNLENAKIATDATELIAHYKGLLKCA